MIQTMAKLLSLLVGDAAMSSVVPFRDHQHLLQTCAAIRNGNYVHNRLQEMREYGFELAHVLDVSMSNNFSVKLNYIQMIDIFSHKE